MGCIRFRYVLVLMTFWAMFVVYSQRVNLSAAIVTMVNHTALENVSNITEKYSGKCSHASSGTENISENQERSTDGPFIWKEKVQGFILGAFFYGYIVTQIPGGRLAEMFGGKWLLAVGLLITSVATMLSPLAAFYGGAYALSALRIIIGLGEGVTYPAIFSLMGQWSPVHERSIMVGITNSGSHLGTVITLPAAAALSSSNFLGGWPAIFYVFGISGLVWFTVWTVLATSWPETSPYIDAEEVKYIQSSRKSGNIHVIFPLRKLLTCRAIWMCAYLKFTLGWGFITLLTYLPHYMAVVINFPIEKKGYLNAIPYIADALISIGSNYIADSLRKQSCYKITIIRKTMLFIGATGAGVCLSLVPLAGCDGYLTLLLFTLALGFYGVVTAGEGPLALDIAPDFSGTVCGLTNGIANASGMVAPLVVGFLTNDHNDLAHWSLVFYLSSAILAIGTIPFLFFGSAEAEPWASKDSPKCNPEKQPLLPIADP